MENRWVHDLNGHLILASRHVQHITRRSADVTQTDISTYTPSINGGLEESERVQEVERQIAPDLHRIDATRFVRDVNGRLQPTETRSREIRATGLSDSAEEETIRRLDANGKLALSEKNIIHRSAGSGQERTDIETFSSDLGGWVRTDGHLELHQRIHKTTTALLDGGTRTVEDVEMRPPSGREPLRLVERTIETMRNVGGGTWATDREVFGRDVNGRLALTSHETRVLGR